MTGIAVEKTRGTGSRRPHVLMYVRGDPVGLDWARAAATFATVTEVLSGSRLPGRGVPVLPFLSRDRDRPERYHLREPAWRPTRVLGRVSERIAWQRWEAAFRCVTADRGPVDILHTHWYPNAEAVRRLGRRFGTPFVITEHSTAMTGLSLEARVSSLGIRRARRAYGEAACVIPVSNSLLRVIRQRGFSGRFVVIPNPVDTSVFRPVEPPPVGEEIRLISVARLSPNKRPDLLLEALAIARREEPRLRLSLVGEGPMRRNLERRGAELGLGEAVRFSGSLSRSEVARALQRSHAFVLASRAENLPRALLEALACGLPVVVADVGGHGEVVGPGDGVIVKGVDPGDFATGILTLAGRLPRFDRLQIAARAEGRFSLASVADRLEDVYRRVVGGGQASRTAASGGAIG